MATVPAVAGTGSSLSPGRALLALLLLTGGCVDKAPPPLWPAPPPPSVATPITSATVVEAPAAGPIEAQSGPARLDAGAPDATILDPESPAAAAAPKASPSQPRPVPGHK